MTEDRGQMMRCVKIFLLIICLLLSGLLLSGCSDKPVNNPHREHAASANVRYGVFSGQPKTLDPARSYSSNEIMFTAQIYEPPLQYHYLKRPYQLVPLTATSLPKPIYLNKNGQVLPADAPSKAVAYTVYNINIKPGIYYQPHPAFAKDKNGKSYYQQLSAQQAAQYKTLSAFKKQGTRELTAADYVYQIKRLAAPNTQAPIAGLMSQYIYGFKNYSKTLDNAYNKFRHEYDNKTRYFDLRQYPLPGARVLGKYRYQIILKGKYPQFLYWLAMPFFAPVPWEADKFYAQAGFKANNINFDWYPVGTGPYMLTVNNPNSSMVLSRNPNFHAEFYPTEGTPGDKAKGLLNDAGKRLPFVDKYIFTLEKESMPMWNKFLQGYYDRSGISSDSFDQAIRVDGKGRPNLTPQMQQKGIRLQTSVEPSVYYLGFNMLDPVVGGNSQRARKLRQAISIVLDYDEFISIFLNGRGVTAQGPIPPGIYGHQAKQKEGFNQVIYRLQHGKLARKSIHQAQRLLAQAGYPSGRDRKTGKPLILHFDAVITGDPAQKSQFAWLRKQFAKLGIQLDIRATQYNRFQEKLRTGNVQLFMLGWSADYPDPENFMFLLYGPQGKVKYGGENASNYSNKEFDRLFTQMKALPNGPERLAIIKKMVKIVRQDAPWVWGFYPQTFVLTHQWNSASKALTIGNNTLKYQRLNPISRAQLQTAWNKPIWWPIWVLIAVIILLILPLLVHYWRKEHRVKRQLQQQKK